MLRRHLPAGCALLLLVLAGCHDDHSPSAPDVFTPTPTTTKVNEFVAAQGLPSFRWTDQTLMRDGYECFYASFGEPQDCPSGCFYGSAYGIRVGDRVGWLGFEDLDGYEPLPDSYFDVIATDDILFDIDTWLAIGDADWTTAWWGLVPTLARDPDTGRSALLSIAAILYTHHSRPLSLDLVNNPAIAADVEILTLISELPVVGSPDIYDEAREIARDLLEGLG